MTTASRSTPGIPPFDPTAPRGLGYRAMQAWIRRPSGRAMAMKVAARVDPTLMRLSGGRVGMGLMMPSVNVTTTGARSGRPRTVTLLYFTDGDDVILVASSFGREKHPAWYHNLKAHPEATLTARGGSGRYRAEEVTEEAERARLFALADRVYAGYADYRAMTAAAGRSIPLLRLRLIDEGAPGPRD